MFQQKDLESVCTPIITKLYAAAGGAPGGMPGGMPGGFPGAGAAAGGGGSAPTVDRPSKRWTKPECSIDTDYFCDFNIFSLLSFFIGFYWFIGFY